MKYRVHLYVAVRCPIEVDAASPQGAANMAERMASCDVVSDLLRSGVAEFAEDIDDECVVDLLDDRGDVVEGVAVDLSESDADGRTCRAKENAI